VVPQARSAEVPDGFWYAAKCRVLGPPLVTEQLTSERLSNVACALPRRSYPPLAGRMLHDHTADRIARRISRVPGAAAVIIPFDVRHRVDATHAKRAGQPAGLKDYERPAPPAGADPIGSLRPHARATVQGRLRAGEILPLKDNTILACQVADSTGDLTALFYGRAHIAGIEPGRQIRLRGTVGIGADGHTAMINPGYELLC
jgi:hypothetical protein